MKIAMKIFHSSTFMNQHRLNEEGISYPIKLEYYKIINEDEITKKKKAKFGINVVKTEYKKGDIKVENKELQHISSDEGKVEEILKVLKENAVTPIILEDVLSDILKEFIAV